MNLCIGLFWHEYIYIGLLWHENVHMGLFWHEYVYIGLFWHEYAYTGLFWHEYILHRSILTWIVYIFRHEYILHRSLLTWIVYIRFSWYFFRKGTRARERSTLHPLLFRFHTHTQFRPHAKYASCAKETPKIGRIAQNREAHCFRFFFLFHTDSIRACFSRGHQRGATERERERETHRIDEGHKREAHYVLWCEREAHCVLLLCEREAHCVLLWCEREAHCVLLLCEREAHCVLLLCEREANCVREKHTVCCAREKSSWEAHCVREKHTVCCAREKSSWEAHCVHIMCCCYVLLLCEREAHYVHVMSTFVWERSTLCAHLCEREAQYVLCTREKHIGSTLCAAVMWERSTLCEREAHCVRDDHIKCCCYVREKHIRSTLFAYMIVCEAHSHSVLLCDTDIYT